MAEMGARIMPDRRTETALFWVVVLASYWLGMRYWPSSPRQSLAPTGAVTQTIVVPQSTADTSLEGETRRGLTTEEIASRCERAIAIVSGRHGTGTGFLVRPGLLATNAHVLVMERIDDLRVTFPAARYESMTTELVFEDPQRDLALLAVLTDLPPLEIESAYKFRRGQDVTVIGNPSAGGRLILENAVSRGVMSTEVVVDGQSYYQLSIAVNPGNSGGPTIDSSGKAIGVVTLKSNRLEATAFCIPSADLLSAITQATSRSGEKATVLAMHRARFVVEYVHKTGEVYGLLLSDAIGAIDIALANRLDPNLAIRLVRQELSPVYQEFETFLDGVFDQELHHVYNDVRISESVRNELRSAWDNCLAMKASIDAPAGTVESYRARASLLQEKHGWYIERLRADLAATNPN
jgi:S1-C subfamily serine protease